MGNVLRVHPLLMNIQKQYDDYQAFIITKTFDYSGMHIVAYVNVMMVCGEEIGVLYNNSWNNSIEPLTRNFIECYAITKKLIELYNTTDFKEYLKYLYYVDIKQTMSVNRGIKNDIKYVSGEAIEEIKHIINKNLDAIKKVIEKFFQDLKPDIKNDNLEGSIKEIIKKLNDKYEGGKFNISISQAVRKAILTNQALIKANDGEKYKGSGGLYAALCDSSHNNISSICKRAIKDGKLTMNVENKNALACLEIVYYCMMDINNLISKLF